MLARRGLLVLAGPDDGRGAGRAVPLDQLPGPGDRRHRGPGHPAGPGAAAGRADRRRRADDRGRRAPRPRPAPGRRQPRDQGVRRPDRAAPADASTPWLFARERPRTAPVGVVADRPRPRAARPRDRPGGPRAGAGPADRVAGAVAGDRGAGRGRRDRAPGQRRARLGGRRTGRARRPATTCTRSTPSAVSTRPSAPTTCSSTRWSGTRRTTSGWATSRGRSTTSCTRTPSARSRRTSSPRTSSGSCRSTRATPARSSSDRRLQRRDDRAPRPVPPVRDLSLFLGGAAELPDASMGPGLPGVRDWARTGSRWCRTSCRSTPATTAGTRALRARLGYPHDCRCWLAAVGGTAVGRPCWTWSPRAFAHLRKEVPDARMVMVTGPRISPRTTSPTSRG